MSHIDLAFSSDSACRTVADRTIRQYAAGKFAPTDGLFQMLGELGAKLRDRRKLSRADMIALSIQLVVALRANPNVVEVEQARQSSSETLRLSSQESYQIRFLFAYVPNDYPNDLAYLACEVSIGRRAITARVTDLNFRINAHTVARFMRRQQMTAKTLVVSMTAAMRMAPILGTAVVVSGSNEMALPLGDGLLLGRSYLSDNAKHTGRSSMLVTYDCDGSRHEADVAESNLIFNYSNMFEIKTFIDGRSCGVRKTRLHAAIGEWYKAHEVAIDRSFEGYAYACIHLQKPEDTKEVRAGMLLATSGAKKLVASPAWQDWVRNIGTEPDQGILPSNK